MKLGTLLGAILIAGLALLFWWVLREDPLHQASAPGEHSNLEVPDGVSSENPSAAPTGTDSDLDASQVAIPSGVAKRSEPPWWEDEDRYDEFLEQLQIFLAKGDWPYDMIDPGYYLQNIDQRLTEHGHGALTKVYWEELGELPHMSCGQYLFMLVLNMSRVADDLYTATDPERIEFLEWQVSEFPFRYFPSEILGATLGRPVALNETQRVEVEKIFWTNVGDMARLNYEMARFSRAKKAARKELGFKRMIRPASKYQPAKYSRMVQSLHELNSTYRSALLDFAVHEGL